MATTLKILGQTAPGATTETDLYTVPGATTAVVSTINIANRSASAGSFRISVSAAGAATTNKDYMSYDIAIAGNEFMAVTTGITLGATDKIRVYASSANMSFQAYGQENS